MVDHALLTLLRELADGSGPGPAYVLNPEDPGLFRSLERLSAAQASAAQAGGGASIAAHVDHLRYGLSLLNRWSRGEEPFADTDYGASWQRTVVSEPEWAARREALRTELSAWRDALTQPTARPYAQLSDADLSGIIGSIVHLAYHFGAIRQIDRSARGPSAQD